MQSQSCQVVRQRPQWLSCKPLFIGLGRLVSVAGAAAFMYYLFLPERSLDGQRRQANDHPAWMGSAKALFWTAISICIGVLLARWCS